MRRHAKASSAGSKLRKPSGHGASPPSGRLRLTILLAAVAAFLLVPAAQAFAKGTLTVNIAGNGSGEVKSKDFPAFGPNGEGEPPIECSWVSPGPKTGNCATTMDELEPEVYFVYLYSIPAAGSGIVGWEIEGASLGAPYCPYTSGGKSGKECLAIVQGKGENPEVTVTAYFAKVQPLTVKKTGGGEGTVVSNPAGIVCAPACSEKTASFEEGSLVTLTANPASGSVFTSWAGCVKTVEGTGAKGHKCTVEMNIARTVTAKFTKVQAISGAKDPEGNGFGTVSSSPGGISCGPACSSATAVFTEGLTVTVKAAPVASTSVFAGWTSCPGTEEGANCKVVASEAKTATAKFNLIPQFALTLSKSGGGTGTVSSAPAGISCGPTCSGASASYNSGKEVTLKAVPAPGSEIYRWSVNGFPQCELSTECKVTVVEALEVGAEFK